MIASASRKLVEHDDELAALDLLDFSRQKITDPARELVADFRPLAFPYALDDALLGRLDGRSSELGEVYWNLHLVADLEIGVLEPGLLEGDLARRVGYLLYYGLEKNDADRSFALIDVDLSLHRWPVLLGEGGIDAVLEKPVQLGAIDLLRVGQLADRRQNLY
jgi:hypothetical protein